jgi:hypothetical protein
MNVRLETALSFVILERKTLIRAHIGSATTELIETTDTAYINK